MDGMACEIDTLTVSEPPRYVACEQEKSTAAASVACIGELAVTLRHMIEQAVLLGVVPCKATDIARVEFRRVAAARKRAF